MDQPWPTAFSMATLKSFCFLTMAFVCDNCKLLQNRIVKCFIFCSIAAFQDKVKDYVDAQVGEKGTRINIPDKRLHILIPLSGECARNLCDKGDGWIEPTKVIIYLLQIKNTQFFKKVSKFNLNYSSIKNTKIEFAYVLNRNLNYW